MSARKLGNTDLLKALTIQSHTTRLDLPTRAVHLHKNGIEFRAQKPIEIWTEMTVALEMPLEKKFQCTGVVVACSGDRHAGYLVSMVFTNLSAQAQQRLNAMASLIITR
jgi:hypothetical protein